MILLKYCLVISHIVQNPAVDTPNKVTNQSPEALIGPVFGAGLWLITLWEVSGPRFRSMWKITKQYINKSIHSIWKCLKYSANLLKNEPYIDAASQVMKGIQSVCYKSRCFLVVSNQELTVLMSLEYLQKQGCRIFYVNLHFM